MFEKMKHMELRIILLIATLKKDQDGEINLSVETLGLRNFKRLSAQ